MTAWPFGALRLRQSRVDDEMFDNKFSLRRGETPMWFWGLAGAVVVAGLGVAGLYDRRARRKGQQSRSASEIEREIAKRGKWDGPPT
jgi:hypothetical protein